MQVKKAHSATPVPVHWKLDSDGWVTDNLSQLLVWVPPDLQHLLLSPRVIFDSSPNHVQLHFDNVQVGESWVRCYMPV